MDDALHVHAHIGVLEPFHPLAACVAEREQRERVTRYLLEDGVVVTAGEGHLLRYE